MFTIPHLIPIRGSVSTYPVWSSSFAPHLGWERTGWIGGWSVIVVEGAGGYHCIERDHAIWVSLNCITHQQSLKWPEPWLKLNCWFWCWYLLSYWQLCWCESLHNIIFILEQKLVPKLLVYIDNVLNEYLNNLSIGPSFQACPCIMRNMKISSCLHCLLPPPPVRGPVSIFCNLSGLFQQFCPTPGLWEGRLDQVISVEIMYSQRGSVRISKCIRAHYPDWRGIVFLWKLCN
jgi:hypothetical protein